MADSYNVVFEGVGGERSNIQGVRTWTSFRDKAHLEEWMKETEHRDTILAEGVTPDEAMEMTRQTSAEALARYIVHESTVNGVLDEEIADMHLKNIILSRQRRK